MSVGEEMNELKERAEAAAERKGLAPVSLTMAIVAVLVATVSLLGHRAHTEEILLQNKTTDQWAYYQAKNLRLNNLQALNDVMGAIEGKNEKAEQVQKRFESNIEKYTEEKNEYGQFSTFCNQNRFEDIVNTHQYDKPVNANKNGRPCLAMCSQPYGHRQNDEKWS